MPAESSQNEELRKRTLLLRSTAEMFMEELSTLAASDWENLPQLKKKKVVLASRFREFDWTPGPADQEPYELTTFKSLISDLEFHSRKKIQAQLELINNQILALQDQHQYWQECLNVSFRKFYEPIPSP